MDAPLASPNAAVAPRAESKPLCLVDLRAGDRGRLVAADLEGKDLELLHALGFSEHCRFRLCKAGNPWIVQVRGTRIGLSGDVARKLRVEPELAMDSGDSGVDLSHRAR